MAVDAAVLAGLGELASSFGSLTRISAIEDVHCGADELVVIVLLCVEGSTGELAVLGMLVVDDTVAESGLVAYSETLTVSTDTVDVGAEFTGLMDSLSLSGSSRIGDPSVVALLSSVGLGWAVTLWVVGFVETLV